MKDFAIDSIVGIDISLPAVASDFGGRKNLVRSLMSDLSGNEESVATNNAMSRSNTDSLVVHPESFETREEYIPIPAFPREAKNDRSIERLSRPRNPTRPTRKHVPNMLSGSPLISGPVTPHFAPIYPPAYPNQYSAHQGNMAIFPTFMLAPSIVAEGSEDFVRQAMQNAIGLPPILCHYGDVIPETHSVSAAPRKSKKKVRQKCDWRKGSAEEVIPPRIDSNFDFPLLDDGPIETPSARFLPKPLKK